MPPALLFDLSNIDIEAEPLFGRSEIEKYNPQAYEMEQLDGVLWYDKEEKLVLGYKDVTEDEFWVRGHIPGRPLMPGVIMLEAAAQLSSVFVKKILGVDGFIGFAGIDKTKFRAPVQPGQRLYLLCHIFKFKTRKYSCKVQGIVEGKMAFETVMSGMRV